MLVRFWGVRGSIPTPLSPEEVRRKISAVVERVTPSDIKTQEDRERFLAGLPPYLFGTAGGNTTCVEVRLSDDTLILFDAGTGISRFAASTAKREKHIKEFHLFITHFHWDHLQGFPFFTPHMFDPQCTLHVYSPREDAEEILRAQMQLPYFPITMDTMQAKIRFYHITEGPVGIGPARVDWRRMKHPGASYSYRITEKNRSCIFSTDTELMEADFEKTEENISFYKDTNLIIMDTQYTLDEAIEKYDWGHSSYSLAVDFAADWNIGTLVLFHHEPLYNDAKMFSIQKSANWYKSHLDKQDMRILLATEGLELEV
ncbi:MAG: MBL fold metallo-hydrolase [Spirochaetaceae bacterium]